MTPSRPALLVVGHGTKSEAGCAQFAELVERTQLRAAYADVAGGFLELAPPPIQDAVHRLVDAGHRTIDVVPLVLVAAGHSKGDIPAALKREELRHPGLSFRYGRPLGSHPDLLAVAERRLEEQVPREQWADTAVVLVGRGSSDPDANADLYKVARLLWDSRGLALVEPAFVSLAQPSVPAALERCRLLGACRIVVVPYFLFTGILVDRIAAQVGDWAAAHPDVDARPGPHLGADPRIARLVVERYQEALAGDAHMNCDLCVYRVALPGYEHHHSHTGDEHGKHR